MTRATHTGECQACGSRQMLPSGVLAKHGYAVLWSQFSGVCSGSHHAPFEQSIEMVKLFVGRARERRDALLANAEKHESGEGPLMYRRRFRLGAPRGTSFHLWDKVASLEWKHNVERTHRWISEIVFADGSKLATFGVRSELALREAYVSHLRAEARQQQGYIDWQDRRVADWAPRALTPRAREVG